MSESPINKLPVDKRLGKQADKLIARDFQSEPSIMEMLAHLKKKIRLEVVVRGELGGMLGRDKSGKVPRSSFRLLLKLSQSTVVRLNLNRGRR